MFERCLRQANCWFNTRLKPDSLFTPSTHNAGQQEKARSRRQRCRKQNGRGRQRRRRGKGYLFRSSLKLSPADSLQDFDVLNVEFEWFDPQPEFDFHGIKALLQQLFDTDGQLFELTALTDLILSQPTLGSTVKVDGNETDAYAFLSILNLQEHMVSLDTVLASN